jgi:hypothetical protein
MPVLTDSYSTTNYVMGLHNKQDYLKLVVDEPGRYTIEFNNIIGRDPEVHYFNEDGTVAFPVDGIYHDLKIGIYYVIFYYSSEELCVTQVKYNFVPAKIEDISFNLGNLRGDYRQSGSVIYPNQFVYNHPTSNSRSSYYFELLEDSVVMIDSYHYGLLAEDGTEILHHQYQSFVLISLAKGKYQVCFSRQYHSSDSGTFKIGKVVQAVTDDSLPMLNIPEMELNEMTYLYEDYVGDVDFIKFNITEAKTYLFDCSNKLFNLYDSDFKVIDEFTKSKEKYLEVGCYYLASVYSDRMWMYKVSEINGRVEVGQSIDIGLTDDSKYNFIPGQDGEYIFYSTGYGEFEITITDSKNTIIVFRQTSYDLPNLYCSVMLKGGEKYGIAIHNRSSDRNNFLHIRKGEAAEVSLDVASPITKDQSDFFRFIPQESGFYLFSSQGGGNACLEVYDKEKMLGWDHGDTYYSYDTDFSLCLELEAGKIYHLKVDFRYGSDNGNIRLLVEKFIFPQIMAGEEHDFTSRMNYVQFVATESGYYWISIYQAEYLNAVLRVYDKDYKIIEHSSSFSVLTCNLYLNAGDIWYIKVSFESGFTEGFMTVKANESN